jgi:hypothetical protein
MSPEGRDFVGRCLRREWGKRMTAVDALRHPWCARFGVCGGYGGRGGSSPAGRPRACARVEGSTSTGGARRLTARDRLSPAPPRLPIPAPPNKPRFAKWVPANARAAATPRAPGTPPPPPPRMPMAAAPRGAGMRAWATPKGSVRPGVPASSSSSSAPAPPAPAPAPVPAVAASTPPPAPSPPAHGTGSDAPIEQRGTPPHMARADAAAAAAAAKGGPPGSSVVPSAMGGVEADNAKLPPFMAKGEKPRMVERGKLPPHMREVRRALGRLLGGAARMGARAGRRGAASRAGRSRAASGFAAGRPHAPQPVTHPLTTRRPQVDEEEETRIKHTSFDKPVE